MTPNRKRRVKRIKAWAIYRTPGKYNMAIISNMDTGPFHIYKTKEAALSCKWLINKFLSVVPCTITYSLPAKKRKPK